MSKANKQPYVRFFASDWLAGTRGMRAIEIGVYITLVAMMYERCQPLPEDPKKLARLCGCGLQAFKTILGVLVEDGKIIRTDAGLWNKRVEKEFEWRSKLSKDAKTAANTRWNIPHHSTTENSNKNNDRNMHPQSDRNASAMHPQCDKDAEGMPNQNPESREKNSVSESSLRSDSETSTAPGRSEGASNRSGDPPGKTVPDPARETYRDGTQRLRYVDTQEPVWPHVKLSPRHNVANPNADFCGPKWQDEHGRPCTESGELLAAPAPEEPFFDPAVDWKQTLFDDCLKRLAAAAGKDPSAIRSLIGRWLRDVGGDAQAKALVDIVDEAIAKASGDRIAFINACVIRRRKARREAAVN